MKTKLLYAMVLASSVVLVACGGSSSSSGGSGDGVATPFDSEAGVALAAMAAQGYAAMAGEEVEDFNEDAQGRSANTMVPRSSGVQCDSGSHHSETSSVNVPIDGEQHSIPTRVNTYSKCTQELKDDKGKLLSKSTSNGRLEQGEATGGYFYTKATGPDNNLSHDYLTGKTEVFTDLSDLGMFGILGDSLSKSRLIQYGKESSNGIVHYSYADMDVDIPDFNIELKMGVNESEMFRLEAIESDDHELLKLDGYLYVKVNNGCLLAATYETDEPLKIVVSDDDDEDGDVVAGEITVEMDSGNVYNVKYKNGVPYVNGSRLTEKQMMEAAMAMSACE